MTPQYVAEVCRVWSGPRGVAPEAVESARDADVQQVAFPIEVCVGGSVDGVLLRRRGEQSRRVLLLSGESLSWLALYRPSPFSASVMVGVDLDEADAMQCYFLGKLSRLVDGGEEASQLEDFDSGEVVELLLADLHRAFPYVPLSASARSALAAPRVDLAHARSAVKRRRMLSAAAFYGSTTDKIEPTGDKQWRAFYDQLQFRVSRSLLCQLEGTAPVSAMFPRQQEAFEFADQVVSFRRLLRSQGATRLALDQHPRVFSFESALEGRRRFLVASLDAFWASYSATAAGQRHVYEIIREGVPCRLYFDLGTGWCW